MEDGKGVDASVRCSFCGDVQFAAGDVGQRRTCSVCNIEQTVGVDAESQMQVVKAAPKSVAGESPDDNMDCPYCAERVKPKAIKCKHCGEFLDGRAKNVPVERPPAGVVQPTSQPKPGQETGNDGCRQGCIIMACIFVVLAIIGSCNPKSSSPSPERCRLCGSRITFMYKGGDLCEKCTKEKDALAEEVEKLKYIERNRR